MPHHTAAKQAAEELSYSPAEDLLKAIRDLYGDTPWLIDCSCRFCGREYDKDDLPDSCIEDCPGEIARVAIARATKHLEAARRIAGVR